MMMLRIINLTIIKPSGDALNLKEENNKAERAL